MARRIPARGGAQAEVVEPVARRDRRRAACVEGRHLRRAQGRGRARRRLVCPTRARWACRKALETAFAESLPLFPDMTSSDLPGSADPALGVSDFRIHHCMYG